MAGINLGPNYGYGPGGGAYGPQPRGVNPDPNEQEYLGQRTRGQGADQFRSQFGRNMTDEEYRAAMAAKDKTDREDKNIKQQREWDTADATRDMQWKRENWREQQAWVDSVLNRFGTFRKDPGDFPPGPGDEISAAEDEARRAAFARAKDQAGLTGRAAMTGLSEALAGRGLGQASGYGLGGGAGIINTGTQGLNEVSREQAINDADNARKRASEALQAAVTMRGQNIDLLKGALGGLTSLSVSY